jgi:hypothetical protein
VRSRKWRFIPGQARKVDRHAAYRQRIAPESLCAVTASLHVAKATYLNVLDPLSSSSKLNRSASTHSEAFTVMKREHIGHFPSPVHALHPGLDPFLTRWDVALRLWYRIYYAFVLHLVYAKDLSVLSRRLPLKALAAERGTGA